MTRNTKTIKPLPAPKTAAQYDKQVKKATKFYKAGNYKEALRYFNSSLRYKDYSPNILPFMAQCLFKLGMKGKAIQMLEHALAQNADNPAICEIIGGACLAMDLNDLAIKCYQLYIQQNPSNPMGYNNLATALRENDQVDDSIELLKSIIPQFPDNFMLWNTLAAAVSFRDGYPASLVFYEEAYRLNPDSVMVILNLALTYSHLGMHEKAWELAQRATELAPNDPKAYQALWHNSFAIGKFDEAFAAMKMLNHPASAESVFMPYDIPQWQGEDLRGKVIFIGAEQGVGDEILFAALYPEIIRTAKHVIIGCDHRLVDLYRHSFPEATVLGYKGGLNQEGLRIRLYDGLEPEKVDYMCLYMQALRYCWRRLEDIPDMSDGFLHPTEDKADYWRQKLATLPHKINVGICWRSGLLLARRKEHYAGLGDWAPLLRNENINFINVQYGDCEEEIREFEAQTGLTIHRFEELDLKDDFEGTAALMKNLDLVIGPATTPLPLAAASGCPAWWLHTRRPWYAFGEERGTPMFRKARKTIKPADMTWADFFPVFTEEEFRPWLETIKATKG
ncbi:tetratricopeptide repeat protein [Luteithermobacter gelatinilyticus]|uniref:tetratricopeptide repeat protein n=1 Tax=Luteithermobacter gelatinilyticus TaxID=2582913 RepID=UPI0011068A6D|nr:tetratricopeptide repeat protein [Luteithermobacter gelatinilyticus]